VTSPRPGVIPSAARDLLPLSGTVLIVLLWSAIDPHDRFTWFLEVAPVLIVFAFLSVSRLRLPLSRLTYVLLTLQAVIMMVGCKYSLA
jgi:putative membrane protein